MKLSHLQRLQMNFSNHLNSWANPYREYTGKETLNIYILHESMNERTLRTIGRKKQKHFGERRDNTGDLSAPSISTIDVQFLQNLVRN